MRLKIGQSARIGHLLCLSKAGNLRVWRNPQDSPPVGISGSYLKRGHFAFERKPGVWAEEGSIDAELQAVSDSYMERKLISPAFFPEVKK